MEWKTLERERWGGDGNGGRKGEGMRNLPKGDEGREKKRKGTGVSGGAPGSNGKGTREIPPPKALVVRIPQGRREGLSSKGNEGRPPKGKGM